MKQLIMLLFLFGWLGTEQSHACCKQKKKKTAQKQARTLEGEWVLTYIEGADLATTYKRKIPTIKFDLKQQKISGNNGCNSYFGTISVEGSHLHFSRPMGSTKMYCQGGGEEQFMDALLRVSSYSFPEEDEVDLISGDIGVMRLKRK